MDLTSLAPTNPQRGDTTTWGCHETSHFQLCLGSDKPSERGVYLRSRHIFSETTCLRFPTEDGSESAVDIILYVGGGKESWQDLVIASRRSWRSMAILQ